MDGTEKMLEGNQQATCDETTTSEVAPTSVEISRDETSHVASSTSHKEENQDLLIDSDNNKSVMTTNDKIANGEQTGNDTLSTECEQHANPPEEIEASKFDSSDVRPDVPGEDKEDDTITEKGEMKPEESERQEKTSEHGDATTQIEDIAASVDAKDMNILTVTVNVEVDVVNDAINSAKEISNTDDQSHSQHNLHDEENTKENINNDLVEHSRSAEPAVISPGPTKDKQTESAAPTEDEERPPLSESTTDSDRRPSMGESSKQLSGTTTPSKPGTPETGISIITTKGDINVQSIQTTPHPPSQPLPDRSQTHASGSTEFMYDENKDFTTPDYDDVQTPLYSVRGDSGVRQERKTFSRGDSTKSVTFADDPMGRRSAKGYGVEEEDEDSSSDEEREKGTPDEGKEEMETTSEVKGEAASEVKGEAASEVKGEEAKESPEMESVGLFTTAVTEEKIEEAKLKRKERSTSDAAIKEQQLVGFFGAPRLEERCTMEDVVGSKAMEHFDKGCILLSEQDHGQAIVCFDKAINLCPKEVRYYMMRGETYLQMCDFQSAILNLKKACVLAPDNDKYYMRLAFIYYFQGQTLFDQCQYAEALESFSRASEMRPEVIGYHTRSVACLAALQRHGECLALVNKRLEVEQSNPDLYIMRARLHELFRNTSLCYYDLKDAIALDPSRAEASTLMRELEAKAEECRNHAIRLQLQGKLKEAMHKITDAVETNPAVADYHLLRGALHRRLHDYNAAIDDFLLALDKTDHNEKNRVYLEAQRQLLLTYNDFAVECFLGGHFEEAIILLNKAIKGEKREKGLYINRGDCFFRLNELHFALADYHQAMELDNVDWMIRLRIASIHNEFGLMDYEEQSYKEAEARFTVAIQHNPRVGSYYICRAKVRYMLENHGGARHDLLMTLHLEPNNEEILSLLPRLFPGKAISDIMRSKAARAAKAEVENAVVMASPVKLPALNGDAASKEEQLSGSSQAKGQTGAAKHVTFASGATAPSDSVMPDLKACMDEISFNTVLAKKKKKVSSNVKSLLHDRQSLWTNSPKLCPQPPARPYAIRGGNPNKNQSNIDPTVGWRSFSVGFGQI